MLGFHWHSWQTTDKICTFLEFYFTFWNFCVITDKNIIDHWVITDKKINGLWIRYFLYTTNIFCQVQQSNFFPRRQRHHWSDGSCPITLPLRSEYAAISLMKILSPQRIKFPKRNWRKPTPSWNMRSNAAQLLCSTMREKETRRDRIGCRSN